MNQEPFPYQVTPNQTSVRTGRTRTNPWLIGVLILLVIVVGAFSVTSAIQANHKITQANQAVHRAQAQAKAAQAQVSSLRVQLESISGEVSGLNSNLAGLKNTVSSLANPSDPFAAYDLVCNQPGTDANGNAITEYFPCTDQVQTIPQPGS